ncbi:hypothetical protein E2C01_064177 [Portunus trituberculatus]|uniref:Uncharacterized protein n=1 Tax=Portunus trituberculatus TaxID=210409 RepID=A0A5B7HN14_PORTR|nr:hypothetical protein [Portunus trituberculatus]
MTRYAMSTHTVALLTRERLITGWMRRVQVQVALVIRETSTPRWSQQHKGSTGVRGQRAGRVYDENGKTVVMRAREQKAGRQQYHDGNERTDSGKTAMMRRPRSGEERINMKDE